MSTANGVYDGLAAVGQAKATLSLIAAVLIASCLCTSGAITINKAVTEKHTEQITATVSNVKCTNNTCSITASYQVNGNSYSINTMAGAPAPSSLTLYYNPKDPSDAETFRTNKTAGFILSSAGLFMLIIGLIIYQVTSKFKVVAAVQGADTLFDFAKQF